ncbi:hypothetical protein C0580_05020 [Candidatus Parcubacteria bacterium]|nr:MAG: hypothetical protein C0580_05020 [Candidatus Parcubacteria bacterium]
MDKKNLFLYSILNSFLILLVFLMGFPIVGSWINHDQDVDHSQMHANHSYEDMSENRLAFMEHRDDIVGEMIHEGDYACCLEKPCTYCIAKTPGHGEGASCHCLDDIANGVHPCGECIGEILEGHGNPYVAKYFATAIAEEVGEQHLATIKQIISEKYDISIEEQL